MKKALWLMGMLCIAIDVIPPARADDTPRPDHSSPDPSHNVMGQQIQGGLLVGNAPAGSRVYFDGQPLIVDGDGRFIFGLGRQAEPRSLLTIEGPDGTRNQTPLTIVQRTYDIEKIDGLAKKKVSPDARDLGRIHSDRKAILEARQGSKNTPFLLTTNAGGVTLDWPVLGRISGIYGSQRILNGQPRSPHLGVDIAAPEGSPIRAPAPGRVNLVHDAMFFTGKTVMLDHGHGLTSVYAHLDHIAVEEGQPVPAGTLLGTVGATGRATGPHLHWGIHWYGIGLDPALLTGPMPPLAPPESSNP